MSRLVKQSQLKEVTADLWEKTKAKFVSDVKYDKSTSTLKQTKNGQETDVVSGLVRVWKDLDYVMQYPYTNVLDLGKRQQGKQYGNNGQVVTANQYWHIVEVDVEENTEYTLMKMHSYANAYKVVFFNTDGTYHSEDNNNAPPSNGWHRKTVRTPQGVTKVGLQLQYGATTVPRANEMMFLRGNVTESINPFIPYADGNLIQVLKDISLEFDNSKSNLKSTTVESAIKEVNSKFDTTVKSVNGQSPNELGNITVNASQIDTTGGNSIEKELSELSIRKVDKYKPTFISDLTVDDIQVINEPIKPTTLIGISGLAGTRTLAGNTATSVPQDTKVSLIRVGLQDYLEGETVTGVEVYAVKKDDNTIVERIIYEGTGVARKPKGFENGDVLYVDVEVNKSFSVEVYFIARLRHNGKKGMKLYGTYSTGIAFDKATDNTELIAGTTINDVSNRVPSILVYSKTTLSDAIVNVELNNTNRLNFRKANGSTQSVTLPTGSTGTVTSVNGQTPNQQGEVTVGIANINGLQTELNNKVNISEVGNGRNQIPRINGNGRLDESIMPDIAITDVIVVPNISDLMTQNVQTGDVVVVQSIGNKTFMCKNPNGQTQDTRFIEINMGYPVVKEINGERPSNTGAITIDGTQINVDNQSNTTIKDEFEKCVRSVNNQMPTLNGDVTITARQINAVVGVQSPKSVNDHLNDLSTLTNNHTNQINTVINRRSAHIGQIINTFNNRGAEFTENGATFIYIGTQKRVTPADYPELARIFNKQAAASYLLPIVSDSVMNFDGASRTSIKHYICAKLV